MLKMGLALEVSWIFFECWLNPGQFLLIRMTNTIGVRFVVVSLLQVYVLGKTPPLV